MNPMPHGAGCGVGVPMFDRDHRAISELLLEVNFYASRDKRPALQAHLLKELARVTLSHFALEEEIMTATRYPGAAAHRLRHLAMMEQIDKIVAHWGTPNMALVKHPLGLLWEAHTAHVENDDLVYGEWLNGLREPGASGRRMRGSTAAS